MGTLTLTEKKYVRPNTERAFCSLQHCNGLMAGCNSLERFAMRIGIVIFTLWCCYLMHHAKGTQPGNAISWKGETIQT